MKQEVHKLVEEWEQSLHMADNTYWKIEGITDPRTFFQHLPKIFPCGMTLLIEGLELGLTSKSWYEQHSAVYTRKVACDTLSPKPDSYHVAFTVDFAEGLCQIIKSQGLARAFYHFKGYSENEILFQFHDAFEGPLVVSRQVNEEAVRDFATALGLTAELALFPNDQLTYLRMMDAALNPPWWRRALKVFKREKESK